MTAQAILEPNRIKNRAGKYLTFVLGDEYYGVEIHKVREIVAMMHITPVPRTQPFIRGVINLRGHAIPVMDLRLKLGLPPVEPTPMTCIVIVAVRDDNVGMIVDRVCDVTDISARDIDGVPSFGTQVDSSVLLGIGKTGGRVTILLDMGMVISNNEIESLKARNS